MVTLQIVLTLSLVVSIYGFSITVMFNIINTVHELCKPSQLDRQHFWKNFRPIGWNHVDDYFVKFFLALLAPLVVVVGAIYIAIQWLYGYRKMPATGVRIDVLHQTRDSYFRWTDNLYLCQYENQVWVFSETFRGHCTWEDYKIKLKADVNLVVKEKFKMRGAVRQITAEKIYKSHIKQIWSACTNFSLPY